MNQPDRSDELMRFADPGNEVARADNAGAEPWKILIVDDEEEVHSVTTLALRDFRLHGRSLQFLHAYSGREAIEIMRQQSDVAMILLDVVMETEHAGLEAVQRIRQELNNHFVRIVLRTGQPGQAPEREVVSAYDINDYKEKTELTANKLFTLMHTGLSLYRELVAIDRSRRGLERVIAASASIFELQSFTQFAHGVLQQLAALLYARSDAAIVTAGISASRDESGELKVLVGIGRFASGAGLAAQTVLDAEAMHHVERAVLSRAPVIAERHFAVRFTTRAGGDHVIYLSTDARFEPADSRLVEVFCQNVAVAFENLALHQEVVRSQRQIILLLSAAIEERSPELRNHVKRVAEYSVLLGQLYGLPEEDLEMLSIGAAMHDLGKVGVPDAVLNKPGRLDDDERRMMETHVHRGQELLKGQYGELLRSAGIVVGQHHEQWNGMGYPLGLAGEQIHVFGRIAGIADVFDALTTRRCYKEPWSKEQVVEFFQEQGGRHFDPQLAALFLDNLDRFWDIRTRNSSEE